MSLIANELGILATNKTLSFVKLFIEQVENQQVVDMVLAPD